MNNKNEVDKAVKEKQSDIKNKRTLTILFKLIKGESLSIEKMALEYKVSTKTITRYMKCVKEFILDNDKLFGENNLIYAIFPLNAPSV